ncbi:MAG: endonuclease III [Bacteroidota bacterium]
MNLFDDSNEWTEKLVPILTKYQGRKHPLEYHNLYQLVVMVVLSAQDSDDNINSISPILFNLYPNMESLAATNRAELQSYISTVEHFENKTNWLLEIAKTIQKDENIPLTMGKLTALKGIGRKSANVILREMGILATGIIVDLHVLRVAPRIGLAKVTKDGNKLERELMQVLPSSIWNKIGMAISFLGREICRPKNPKCEICPINRACKYYSKLN